MSKEIVHSLVLVVAIAITFVFPKTNFAAYDLQISAGLFLILFVTKKFLVRRTQRSLLLESVIFTLVVLGIINTTGGVESPFFFLIYFLLFSLSLLLEPVISITATLTLIIFFLLNLPENQSFKALLPIFSLAFLTPFALFMGTQYLENQRAKENTFLFLSLMLKNHLKSIKMAVENFLGDHELESIRQSTRKMEKLIEQYEKDN